MQLDVEGEMMDEDALEGETEALVKILKEEEETMD